MAITLIKDGRQKFYTCTWWDVEKDTMCNKPAYYAQTHLQYGYCKKHGEIIINRYPRKQKKAAIENLRKQGAKI